MHPDSPYTLVKRNSLAPHAAGAPPDCLNATHDCPERARQRTPLSRALGGLILTQTHVPLSIAPGWPDRQV